ncbi:hypothetical protein LTS16_019260 [Friedmanniomyces endolithicus]|nr:hypothetical protein LTR94_021585 [Friedmanniomyces endolithicus]KAK0769582.1 hypothetical protein LTR38_017838 [Friedmanniomyces endolithicus]KAK0769890.1 hypothetical protein LTR59_016775 [Friedmanniomyces endolithicus]KAK0770228.1 hypothetical protein LTR75_017959 [Friedmanniomyces endolithicus]KAK0829573.1 hypothetical protein LTR03_016202 [Friedmanniomyces endolithicus]
MWTLPLLTSRAFASEQPFDPLRHGDPVRRYEHAQQKHGGLNEGALKIDLTANSALCDKLSQGVQETNSIRQEVEGQLFWAPSAAMECGTFDAADEDIARESIAYHGALNDEALDRLGQAEKVCESFAGKDVDPTQGMTVEIDGVRRMLDEGVSTS